VSLSDQLKELSNNISEIASKAQMEGSTEKIEQLQNEYNSILEKAFNDAKQQVVASIKAKEEAEKEQAKQKAKENFIETMEPMITRITEELNPAEQAKMFQVIVNLTEARLNDDKMLKEFEQDPMQVKLAGEMFSRMSSIMFNHVMIQFSTLMANITEAAPVVIEQMTAVITAGCMLYNYSPLLGSVSLSGLPIKILFEVLFAIL
jgi:CRISPR/Cas system CSM-associated protein Csm2 small subunit